MTVMMEASAHGGEIRTAVFDIELDLSILVESVS